MITKNTPKGTKVTRSVWSVGTLRSNKPSKLKAGILVIVFALVGVYFIIQSRAEEGFIVPSTIVADCSIDVTPQLIAWIATIPDNSTISLGQGACYRIDSTLELSNRNNIIIEGNGATFRAVTDGRETENPRARRHLSFMGGSNITVRNVVVRGANPNAGTSDSAYVAELEAQHAFQISGVQGLLLDNVQAYDVYGDFVYVGPMRTTPQVLPTNVTVKNSRFERNGRQGFAITGGSNVLFENNYMGNTRRASVDIEPNRPEDAISFITFRNNQFDQGRLMFFANHGAAAPISDITFEGNHGNKEPNISVSTPAGTQHRKRYKFINNNLPNDFGGPGGTIWGFNGVDDIEVRGNTISAQINRSMYLVGIWESTNVQVTNNSVRWGVGSLRIGGVDGGGNANYCYSDNYVGDPLYLEPSSSPCAGGSTGDLIAPVVTITSPVSGPIKGKKVSVKASAVDNSGVKKLDLYIDGALRETVNASSIATTWDISKIARGAHVVVVKSYDIYNNVGQSSVTVYK